MIGGGFKAVRSVFRYGMQIGPLKLWQTVNSKNACKACAFGTGGQNGGFYNEARRGVEICNKNIQAHLSDVRPGIGNTVFFEKSVAELAQLSGHQLEKLGRLTTPLYKAAGDSHYTPVSYDTALQKVVCRLRQTRPERSFFYASGRSANEAAFLLQLFARLYGTNNVNNCSYYCHQASGVALTEAVGTSTATVRYDDLDLADLVFVFGANPASNHPRFVKSLIQLRRRGGEVVVVNPAREAGLVRFASPSDWRSMLKGGEKVASAYVQPHLGGDIAFMQGVAKAVLELGAADDAFIAANTEGFAAFAAEIEALDWAEIEQRSGVARAQMQAVAELYRHSERAVFCWSMGLTHHTHGVHNIQMLVSLALLRGMVGKPGAGLLPLRGHSNIQGTGSMGFTPQLKQAVQAALEKQCGQRLPEAPGKDTMACMEAAARGEMDLAVMLGGNLLASNPDSRFATDAINRIGCKCFFNTTLNLSHVQGVDGEVVILPVRARDEERQATTQESMFNFVRMSDGGIDRFPALRSEVDLIGFLGEQVIAKDYFDFSVLHNNATVRDWIARTVPGFAKIAEIDRSKTEFHIDGRILHQPQFATDNGKARFFYHPAPARDTEFMLSSVRSEGQFNSIIYHEFDAYRGQRERWVVLMNPQDIKRKGYRENQLLDLKSATGEMSRVKLKAFDVRAGNILVYYPEANVLVAKTVDSKSRTPGFKSVPVSVTLSA